MAHSHALSDGLSNCSGQDPAPVQSYQGLSRHPELEIDVQHGAVKGAQSAHTTRSNPMPPDKPGPESVYPTAFAGNYFEKELFGTPSEVFPSVAGQELFVHRTNKDMFLMYTAGHYFLMEYSGASGYGFAYFYGPPSDVNPDGLLVAQGGPGLPPSVTNSRGWYLDVHGTLRCFSGNDYSHVSNTLEDSIAQRVSLHHGARNASLLMAIVAALRKWTCAGPCQLVIATDCLDIFNQATTCLEGWVSREFRYTKGGFPIWNSECWEELWTEIQRLSAIEVKVQFWKISKVENRVAQEAARKAMATSLAASSAQASGE